MTEHKPLSDDEIERLTRDGRISETTRRLAEELLRERRKRKAKSEPIGPEVVPTPPPVETTSQTVCAQCGQMGGPMRQTEVLRKGVGEVMLDEPVFVHVGRCPEPKGGEKS